jgi:hypothetical protein
MSTITTQFDKLKALDREALGRLVGDDFEFQAFRTKLSALQSSSRNYVLVSL